eukprot:292481-Chlamydomonas_euryale.AAC.2
MSFSFTAFGLPLSQLREHLVPHPLEGPLHTQTACGGVWRARTAANTSHTHEAHSAQLPGTQRDKERLLMRERVGTKARANLPPCARLLARTSKTRCERWLVPCGEGFAALLPRAVPCLGRLLSRATTTWMHKHRAWLASCGIRVRGCKYFVGGVKPVRTQRCGNSTRLGLHCLSAPPSLLLSAHPACGPCGVAAPATLLINSGFGPLVTLGLIAGFIGSGAMIYYNGKRTADTTDEDIAPDWPGPKAWPAGMTLISFFALNVFLQGLRAEL